MLAEAVLSASASRCKDKASRYKAKPSRYRTYMSSSVSLGVASSSGDHSGQHDVPASTILSSGVGVIPGP